MRKLNLKLLELAAIAVRESGVWLIRLGRLAKRATWFVKRLGELLDALGRLTGWW
jgi:hypothetical protein